MARFWCWLFGHKVQAEERPLVNSEYVCYRCLTYIHIRRVYPKIRRGA